MNKNQKTKKGLDYMGHDLDYYMGKEHNWRGLKKLVEHFKLNLHDVAELIIKTYSSKTTWNHYRLAGLIYKNLQLIKEGRCSISRKPNERDLHLAIRMDKGTVESYWKKLGRGGNFYRGVKEFYMRFSDKKLEKDGYFYFEILSKYRNSIQAQKING
jgi:hypothetical protein